MERDGTCTALVIVQMTEWTLGKQKTGVRRGGDRVGAWVKKRGRGTERQKMDRR